MRPRRAQGGQAMVEFVVAAVLFALPVFLIIPLLGKYADMKSTAIQGARYAAWERTVFFAGRAASVSWPGVTKSDDEIRNELRQRLFSEGTGIANGDKSAGNWGGSGLKNAWRNRNGTVMLPSYNSVTQSVVNDDTPSIVNDVLNLIVTVTDAIGSFTLEMKGLYGAEVAVAANTLPINMSLSGDTSKSFNPGTLTFRDKNVILANTWSANGAAHVKSQTEGLTPTGIFNNPIVKVIWDIGRIIFAIATPEILFLELGKIEPDVVPPDRLVDP